MLSLKRKKNEMGGWLFCPVLRVAATSDTWFQYVPWETPVWGQKVFQPHHSFGNQPFSGQFKKTGAGLTSLAFGEGLAGEGGHSCCYTQSHQSPRPASGQPQEDLNRLTVSAGGWNNNPDAINDAPSTAKSGVTPAAAPGEDAQPTPPGARCCSIGLGGWVDLPRVKSTRVQSPTTGRTASSHRARSLPRWKAVWQHTVPALSHPQCLPCTQPECQETFPFSQRIIPLLSALRGLCFMVFIYLFREKHADARGWFGFLPKNRSDCN